LRGRGSGWLTSDNFFGKQTVLVERAEIPAAAAAEDQDTMVGLAADKIVEWNG